MRARRSSRGALRKVGESWLPGCHHQMTAGRGRHPAEKIVIELLGTVAGRGGVENIARHQQDVHLLLDYGVVEPVKKAANSS